MLLAASAARCSCEEPLSKATVKMSVSPQPKTRKAKAGEELSVVIGADASLQHGRVISIIDLIKGEGIVKLGLSTQAEFSAPAASEQPTP